MRLLRRTAVLFTALSFAGLFGFQSADNHDLGDIAPNAASVRAVGFGDWGYQGSGSGFKEVGLAIARIHAATPFTFGFTLGDNFYPVGVRNTKDRAWNTFWESGYGKLGIRFFAVLGNHDYEGSPQAEIDYTKVSPSQTWRMPYRYYTFAAGPVRFFALDTDENLNLRNLHPKPWSKEQSEWLDNQLAKFADARWKIVYGHHPVFNDGKTGGDARMVKQLFPILKLRKADAYLCGHDHNLQHFTQEGIEFFLVGGGGKDPENVSRRKADYVAPRNGFLTLEADAAHLTFGLQGVKGTVLFEKKLAK